jgi:hypothetical protein
MFIVLALSIAFVITCAEVCDDVGLIKRNLCAFYSVRSATIGSTLAARTAGIQDATSAAAQSNTVAMVSIRGSHGETP